MAEGVVATDEEGKVTSINPALLKNCSGKEKLPQVFIFLSYFPNLRYRNFSPER